MADEEEPATGLAAPPALIRSWAAASARVGGTSGSSGRTCEHCFSTRGGKVNGFMAGLLLVTLIGGPARQGNAADPGYQLLISGSLVGTFSVAEGLQTEATLTVPGPIRLAYGRVRQELASWARQSRANPGIRLGEIVVRKVDESGSIVRSWRLLRVGLKGWTGPTLIAKGGADVVVEEVVLSVEEITLVDDG